MSGRRPRTNRRPPGIILQFSPTRPGAAVVPVTAASLTTSLPPSFVSNPETLAIIERAVVKAIEIVVARVAECHLWTHPSGGEARITVGGEWQRGEAGRDGLALVELALGWKASFIEKGWV